MDSTRLSICIPAHNAARSIASTLESILEEKGDFEVCVFENASTDDTYDIVRAAADDRVVIHRSAKLRPIMQSFDGAVTNSTRELVRVVCSDDIITSGSNDRLLEPLADDAVGLASGRYTVIDTDGAETTGPCGLDGIIGRPCRKDVARAIIRRGPARFGPTHASIFRREDYDRVGGFRSDFIFPADVDLFVRILRDRDFVGLPTVEASWRASDFNVTSSSSTVSKLQDLLHFHHQSRTEDPSTIRRRDVAAGDWRVAHTALSRLRIRALQEIRNRL